MQGYQQAAREDASLAFKRFILRETDDFEKEPRADLFRVNLLTQMLDRYDEMRGMGAGEEISVQRVQREFADIPARMRAAGFEREYDYSSGEDSRWPVLDTMDAQEYLDEASERTHKRALGVGFMSACMAPLFITLLDVDFAPLGLIGMCGMIGLGLYAFFSAGKPRLDAQVKKGRFSLDRRAQGKLGAMRASILKRAGRHFGKGVALLSTCMVPLFAGFFLDSVSRAFGDAFTGIGFGGTFLMIGVGMYELLVGHGEKKSIKRLLRE